VSTRKLDDLTMGKAKRDAGRIGGHLSAGNCTTGEVKKAFGSKGGKRSGLRRKAKVALVIKKPWLDKILSRRKTWEIRGCSTTRRGAGLSSLLVLSQVSPSYVARGSGAQ